MRYQVKTVFFSIALLLLVLLAFFVECTGRQLWANIKTDNGPEYIANIGTMKIYADDTGRVYWTESSYE